MDFHTLWDQLGLDSLLPTSESVTRTLRPDWEQDTFHSGVHSRPEASPPLVRPPSLRPPVPSQPGNLAAQPDASGDLVVVGELGHGGMGTVLLARQATLDREVAVKVPLKSASASLVRSLVREARTTGSLEHPGIIPVHAIVYNAEGLPALVMKRVEGVSWSTILEDPEDPLWAKVSTSGKDRLETNLIIFMQVCNAVAFAHRQGVLHRDIKPANILIGEYGEVYLADWGVALRKEARETPHQPSLVGTPVYFAPEMCTGDDAAMDERTDVYLLSATLYQVLAGTPPHAGYGRPMDTLTSAWEGAFRPLPAEVPIELAELCLKGLASRKEDRFQSAHELRDAVAAFLRHRSGRRLATAAAASLMKLTAALARLGTEAPAREAVYPLVSECRFGFMQALAEWPDNAQAREGLSRCLEQAAWFEIHNRNSAAARALLKERGEVPADLEEAVRALEAGEKAALERDRRLARLQVELDPKVALAERTRVVLALSAAIVAVTVLPLVMPGWQAFEALLGRFLLLARLVPAVLVFSLAVYLARRTVLETALNRHVVGVVALCLAVVGVDRVLGPLHGVAPEATLALDLVALAAISAGVGLMLHWSFFLATLGTLTAAVACTLDPPNARLYFGAGAALSLVGIALAWPFWRGMLGPSQRE